MKAQSKKAGAKKASKRKAAKAPQKNAKDKPLTPKREKFAHNYVDNGGNGKKAAEDAGFAKGASAEVEASRLLRNAKVQEIIRARQAEAQVEKSEIVGTLASHMRGDLTDLLRDGDEIRELARERGVSHLIKKLKRKTRFYSNGPGKEPDKEVTYEFEMYSAQEAAKQLCSVFGLNKKEGENTEDEKARVELAIKAYIDRTGANRDEAVKNLIPFIPEVSKYAN